jgi:hypothetical protein
MTNKYEKLQILKNRCEELNYTLLTTEYVNNKTKLYIICDKGHNWHPTFDNFINKNRKCRKCADIENANRQKEKWVDIVNLVESHGYILLSNESDYENQNSKLKALCPNNHTYEFLLPNFKKGKRCSECNKSGGEQEIERILQMYSIDYIFNYRFSDDYIKNKPYDFYIPSLNLCIEYDGQQHYHMQFDYSLLDLMNRKYIDDFKSEYCFTNDINLIRIPYWDFDIIEQILINELNLIK